ncbi:PLP-dependent transferase, partial [Fodinicurvata halophila]|uniref:PLP-dependent transferase n=1 Tax=Fodinicurvata halophila TaxID=1419723 RepID=UPI0036169E2C
MSETVFFHARRHGFRRGGLHEIAWEHAPMTDQPTHDTPACTASAEIPEWSEATQLVQGGVQRSGFDETCEALYMTSGYVYNSAEEAEAAFQTDGLRFVYSRFRNPTVEMFETRLCQLEGAEACRATASGMAAVWAALIAQLQAGDRVVASR